MSRVEKYVEDSLFALADAKYKVFHQSLIPTVHPDRVIGVRTPQLRKFAKTFGKTDGAEEFISILPHKYYEEDNLHAFLIEQIKDFDVCISLLDKFLPYVNNWATCDMMSPKIFSANLPRLSTEVDRWLASEHIYEVRFGIITLMRHYLDEAFDDTVIYKVLSVQSDEYYINMARAWFFATALINHYEEICTLLRENTLDTFTHNKTIQKAIESYRITKEQKAQLKELRRR